MVRTEHDAATGTWSYMANGVEEIICTDKHGEAYSLENSPSIEMGIRDKKGQSHIFYFDTINLQDSTFTSMKSRILGTRKSINFADIKTVEAQNGRKAYRYAGQ